MVNMRKCSICGHWFENVYKHVTNHVIKGGGSYPPQLSLAKNERWYPDVPVHARRWLWGDHFGRTTLVPTGHPTIWDVSSGTHNIDTVTYIQHGRDIQTAGGAGADGEIFGKELPITIGKNNINTLKVTVTATVISAASTEMFVGFRQLIGTALSALPTTSRHAGIVLDQSANANWRFDTGDNVAQNISNSTLAADVSGHDFIIIWTSGSVAFYVDTTLLGTNVANLPTTQVGYMMCLYLQSEGAPAAQASVDKFQVEYW